MATWQSSWAPPVLSSAGRVLCARVCMGFGARMDQRGPAIIQKTHSRVGPGARLHILPAELCAQGASLPHAGQGRLGQARPSTSSPRRLCAAKLRIEQAAQASLWPIYSAVPRLACPNATWPRHASDWASIPQARATAPSPPCGRLAPLSDAPPPGVSACVSVPYSLCASFCLW